MIIFDIGIVFFFHTKNTIMKAIITSLLLTGSALLAAQEPAQGGISFEHGTWTEALAKAKKENKLIMLDAYASWCGPCKWMAKNIFPQKEVGEFYNKNFVNIKIDMEKGEGVALAQKYGVVAYPTFFYIDGDGNMVHRTCGGQEAEEFIKAGKDALNPEAQLAGMQKKFAADSRNSALALSYFDAADKGCMNIEEDVKKYIGGLKPETYAEKENFMLIDKFINDYSHASFIYLMENYDAVVKKADQKEVDRKILTVYRNSIIQAGRKKDEAKMKDIRKSYSAQKNAPVAWLDAYLKMTWAGSMNDTAAYLEATVDFTDKFMQDDAQALNAAAWDFYEKTNNKPLLQKAEAWAKRSVELEAGYANMDTYAAILCKLGKYTEAKIAAQKAIETGKSQKADVKETEELLKRINEKLKA